MTASTAAVAAAPVVVPDSATTKRPKLNEDQSAVEGKLRVKLLSPRGRQPTRGSPLAAGYDLYSAASIVIPARGRALVPTDISVAVPVGTYGRVAPRSGLAVKHGLDVGAGVVDADYRGPLGVVMFNFSENDYEVKEGERIAQFVLEKIMMTECEVVEELDDTERGTGGFGSTGKH